MHIIIDDTNDLSALDLRILRAVVGDDSGTTVVVKEQAEAPEVEETKQPDANEVEPPKRKRRTKAEMEAARAAEAAAEKDDEPAEPSGDADADADEGKDEEPDSKDEPEDEDAGNTMKDAVKLASALVGSGRAGDVKEQLAEYGVKRVSELKAKDLPAFIEALS